MAPSVTCPACRIAFLLDGPTATPAVACPACKAQVPVPPVVLPATTEGVFIGEVVEPQEIFAGEVVEPQEVLVGEVVATQEVLVGEVVETPIAKPSPVPAVKAVTAVPDLGAFKVPDCA